MSVAGFRRRRGDRPPLRSVGHEPDYRFSLANERTFLAWIRTSLALLAGGVAVHQVVPNLAGPRARLLLTLLVIGFSIMLAALSYRRWEGNERAMRTDQPLPAFRMPLLLAVGVTVVAVAVSVLLVATLG